MFVNLLPVQPYGTNDFRRNHRLGGDFDGEHGRFVELGRTADRHQLLDASRLCALENRGDLRRIGTIEMTMGIVKLHALTTDFTN